MRSHLPAYELFSPQSLDEALRLMAKEPGIWRPIAGGTDLMVLLAAGKLPFKRLINIWGLPDLHGIVVEHGAVTMGALTTYTEVQENPILRSELGMLCQAAAETGGWAIQNRGTLGGNIANASPAADSSPALLAYDAEVEVMAARGSRWLSYDSFHTGYKTTQLMPNELIARIRVQRPRGPRVEHFHKVGPRRAQAISKVCFAGCVDLDAGGKEVAEVRIAVGGVAPVVMRCPKTEAEVRAAWREPDGAARAAKTLAGEISPIDDVRSSARYRRQVAQNLLGQLIGKLREHVGLDGKAG